MRNPSPIIQRYLSVREAVAYTGLGEKSVREAVRRGDLPAKRVGRRLLIDKDGIDQLPNVAKAA